MSNDVIEPADKSGRNDIAGTLWGVLRTPALRRLLDVRQGINMSVEVFDRSLQPQLPPLTGPAATRVRRLVGDSGVERWRPIIEECFRTAAVKSLEGPSLVAVAAPIVVGDLTAGVVLVAVTRDAPADASVVVLRMAEWFSDLISTRLLPRAANQTANVRQLSSLYRLLSQVVPAESERTIVYRFAEAVAVWTDVEIRGYIGDVAGQYSLAVSLPGSDTDAAPVSLENRPIPDGTSIRHLSANECRELGFRLTDDVVLAVVGGHSEWLLAASNAAEIDLDVQLPSYVDALAHALSDCSAVESSRLTWALMQHFLQFAAPEDAAQAAVAEIGARIHSPVHMAVLGSRGLVLFSGDHAALLASKQTPDVVTVPIAAPSGFTALLGTRPMAGKPLSHGDMRCLRTASAAFATWLPHAIATLVSNRDYVDRRTASRSFDQVVERQSAQAAAQHDDISLLVIAAREALGLEATQRYIGRIREHLRPADLAGRLSTGEIGVLLPQTPHPGACVVGQRLSTLLRPTEVNAAGPPARINVASRSLQTLIYGPLPEGSNPGSNLPFPGNDEPPH